MMKTTRSKTLQNISISTFCLLFTACSVPGLEQKVMNKESLPKYEQATAQTDTVNVSQVNWKTFFTDPNLSALIDSALNNNQELNIVLREIEIAKNEVRAKKGEYLPSIGLQAGVGTDKTSRYTRNGAFEANNEIIPGKEFPDPLSDFRFGAYASWELDVWKKLRNAKKAAVYKYLSSIEGKNFMVTHLVAEIANTYYELQALDNQMDIIKKNIDIQSNALQIVKMQKESALVSELAVKKFEAEVFDTRSLQYSIQQKIVETENRMNFLLGRFPQPIVRDSKSFYDMVPTVVKAGIPSQLLQNRPDIRQAEYDLSAAKLNVKSARASFFPSVGIQAGIGYQAFNPQYLLRTPEALLFSMAGELMAPLVNRNAIKAAYYTANAKQIQAVYNYNRSILNGFMEVTNQLAKINNLANSYDLKAKQVEALTQSINISNDLFRSARANYMEVLMTQRDALESKMELIETKKQQLCAVANIYQALGGGWSK